MIEVAHRKFSGCPGLDLWVGDAVTLPWPDSSFGEVMCTFTLHHLPHPDRALTEMARVLKPGGHLLLADLILPQLLPRPLNWILQLAEGTELKVQTLDQTLDSLRRLFLQAPLDLASPRRLAPFVFLLIGAKRQGIQRKPPAAKEKGTRIA